MKYCKIAAYLCYTGKVFTYFRRICAPFVIIRTFLGKALFAVSGGVGVDVLLPMGIAVTVYCNLASTVVHLHLFQTGTEFDTACMLPSYMYPTSLTKLTKFQINGLVNVVFISCSTSFQLLKMTPNEYLIDFGYIISNSRPQKYNNGDIRLHYILFRRHIYTKQRTITAY